MPILKIEKLTKKYGKTYALNGLDMEVKKGDIYGFVGPNGAGKSTILKMITGIMKPSSGEILFEDHLWTRKDLKDIGALIEEPAIYPNLTAKENLEVASTLYGLPKKRVEEVLDIIGLRQVGKKKVRNFSLGMKQRLGLGMAIINNPKLLILDEPTNGLDPIGIEELRELIRSFPAMGITVILSSHILSEVAQVADKVGIISNGIVGYDGEISKEDDLENLFKEIIKRNRGED